MIFSNVLVAALASLAPVALASAIAPRATVCNGHAELCSRSYGNVSYIGAHNSYAIGSNNLAANQNYDIDQQLTDGIRMLQVQAHSESGTLTLCHTTCTLLKGDTLLVYLGKVKKWMNANPNEVVTILIVNIDNQPASAFASVYAAAGVDTMSYAPSNPSLAASDWLPLGQMIDQGKRLVTFLDNGANAGAAPYLIDEFSNIWETAFDVTDQTFDCNVNRTGTPDQKMYLINHFLDTYATILGTPIPVPDKEKLNVTNGVDGYGSLGLQASQCSGIYGKYPTFLLVDYYNFGEGSVFQVGATLNGVPYDSSKKIAPPIISQGGSSGSGNGSATSKPIGAAGLVSPKGDALTLVTMLGSLVAGIMIFV
jgi:hypothetical protein